MLQVEGSSFEEIVDNPKNRVSIFKDTGCHIDKAIPMS